jgi:hypothetical protein
MAATEGASPSVPYDGEIADWVEARGLLEAATEGCPRAPTATPTTYTSQGGYASAPADDAKYLLKKMAPPSLLLGKQVRLEGGGYAAADEADSGKPVAHAIVAIGLGANDKLVVDWSDGDFDRAGAAKSIYVAACAPERADKVLEMIHRELRAGRIRAGEVRDVRGSGSEVRVTLWSAAPANPELLGVLEETAGTDAAVADKN